MCSDLRAAVEQKAAENQGYESQLKLMEEQFALDEQTRMNQSKIKAMLDKKEAARIQAEHDAEQAERDAKKNELISRIKKLEAEAAYKAEMQQLLARAVEIEKQMENAVA